MLTSSRQRSSETGSDGRVPVRWSQHLGSAVVGAVVVLLGWLPAALAQPSAVLRALGVGLGVLAAAGVAVRWRHPVPAAASVVAGTVAATLLGVTHDPFLAAAWALYPAAVQRSARASRAPLVVVAVLGATAAVVGTPAATGSAELVRTATTAVAALAVSWVLGMAVGRQLSAVAEVQRTRARQQIDEVALHTAREVHDVVAHTLGTIGAEAGVVRVLPDADERELREVLGSIEGSSRRALEQVQALLRALRAAPHPLAPDPLAPSPGLADLPALVERARAAGLTASLHRSGGQVGAGTGSTAYRVVQEGLANVARHAPAARCEVVVEVTPQVVRVTVADDGPGLPEGAAEGLGLTGLRERVALAGGTARIGERLGGGLVIAVVLPAETPGATP